MAKKHKKKKNRLSLIIMLILFVAAGVVVYFVWDSYFKDKKKDDDFQKPESVQIEEKQNSEEEEGKLESENPTKPKVIQYDGEDPNTAEVLTGAVTYAGINNEKLMIRINIDQYLESGVCVLNLVRNGNVIYESTANVIGNVSTGTCEGFDIATEGLGSGETEIVIKVNSGEKSGTIRSGITI